MKYLVLSILINSVVSSVLAYPTSNRDSYDPYFSIKAQNQRGIIKTLLYIFENCSPIQARERIKSAGFNYIQKYKNESSSGGISEIYNKNGLQINLGISNNKVIGIGISTWELYFSTAKGLNEIEEAGFIPPKAPQTEEFVKYFSNTYTKKGSNTILITEYEVINGKLMTRISITNWI